MRRITVQARQLQPGDEFSMVHHDLYQGTVTGCEKVNSSSVRVTTDKWLIGYTLDLNHPVTVYRGGKR